MGVPKFFRYISERYPCLSQLVTECEIPEFDNLYLDMNGIIHNCSHPNDYDPHFRISEEKIFKDIFHYIEILFRIIKPQKLFFMAVDGVAPRAKMNQQRGRRFRSAKEAEDQERALINRGEALPSTQRFDSNCITPGTLFMAKLQAQLKYFVTSKISSDKTWQKVTVILSGHECPGEGEHKIMDYIRYLKSQPNYDPNTKHCLYGLDADLIMLGLCSHEPRFSLLREEVKFGRKQQSKKISSPEDTRFFLLHLSLLREYLEMEFSCLKVTLNFKFVLENIIDDWVLMGFLVGNDFIPHLPGLHISSGALPVLYKAYCEVLPTLDGYLNEAGKLNLARFEAYMKKLASFDVKQFKGIYEDVKYMKQKCSNNAFDIKSDADIKFRRKLEPFFEVESDDVRTDGELTNENDEDFDRAVHDMMDLEEDEDSDYYDEDNREEDRLAFFQEFCLHKQNYYQDKLDYMKISAEELKQQAEGYVTAIQWNLHYYYDGIRSWSWYYPHHYAPYISDIQNFKDMKIEFELGKPFLPFEQLLAVLPSLSKDLLPKPFQELMTSQSSPIIDYYPCNFDTDLNGKKNDWEAVVLIPFIDEQRLLMAMESCYHRLTDEEKQRNKHGPMHVYTYTLENLGRYEAPAYFNPIDKNYAIDTPLRREDIFVPEEKLRKGLLDGVQLDMYFPGFPTFKHLQYTSALEARGVKVFQSSSQGLNMIVKIIPQQNDLVWENLLTTFVNKTTFVGWPYLTEAKIVGICSRKKKCLIEAGVCQTINTGEDHVKSFASDVSSIKQTFLKTRGIEIGNTEYLLQVRIYEGEKFVFGPGKMIGVEKKWSNKIHSYPLQTVVNDISTYKKEVRDITLNEIYPPGSNCFVLNRLYYGCLGIVSDRSDNDRVRLKVNVPPEPSREDLAVERTRISYYTNNEAAYRSCIPNHLLARITGTILVLDVDDVLQVDKCSKVNIGLNLKFSRRNQLLPGYTKRTEQNQWLYSDKTIALVREYADTFPEVIRYLAENSDKDHIMRNDLFPLPGQSHMLNVITNWLDSKLELKGERRNCDASLLEADVIANLETKIEHFYRRNKRGSYVNMKAKPFHLYMPSSQVEKNLADYAEFRLMDRVANVRDNFVVPLGYRGTIIGIEKQQRLQQQQQQPQQQQQSDDNWITLCDILFDQSFNSATQYFTKKKRVYRLPDKCLLNITYAEQKRNKEDKKPVTKSTKTTTATVNLSQNISQDAMPIRVYKQPTIEFRNSAFPSVMTMPSISATPHNTSMVPAMTYPSVPSNIRIMTASKSQSTTGSENLPSFSRTVLIEPVAATSATTTAAANTARFNAIREEQEQPTLALKKLLGLRIADGTEDHSKSSSQTKETNDTPEISYVVELQELFQKAGKGIPKYDYTHVDGNFRATVHVPEIEIGINSELAPTKKAAGERAAFYILRFLNLVQNYGDRVSPMSAQIDKNMLDAHLNFLRMQQTLHENTRLSTTIDNRVTTQQQYVAPLSSPYESDSVQGAMRPHVSYVQPAVQNMQLIMNAHSQHQPTQSVTTIHQQFIRPPQTSAQFHPSISPLRLAPRPMTTASNYSYQQALTSKYQFAQPPQLYYQNVQNIYCSQPNFRGQYPMPTVATNPSHSQQWFSPIIPQSNLVQNVQPRQFYQEYVPQHLSQNIEKSATKNLAYHSPSQSTYVPSDRICTKPLSNVDDVSQNLQTAAICSGRVSKTPKKNRLAANFTTKAST